MLRVNALATFSLRWLLPRMSRFRAEHPDIEVRLTTSNEPVDALPEPFDVVIRGGPDTFHGFASRFLLSERRLPVCSPALLAKLPLTEVADLARHTLLHVTSMPRLWRDWLAEAGESALEPAASLTFDHFYLTIQAALDGLGVAMGPTALIADDLAAGRLVTPFPDISLPARSYFAYFPEGATTIRIVRCSAIGWSSRGVQTELAHRRPRFPGAVRSRRGRRRYRPSAPPRW